MKYFIFFIFLIITSPLFSQNNVESNVEIYFFTEGVNDGTNVTCTLTSANQNNIWGKTDHFYESPIYLWTSEQNGLYFNPSISYSSPGGSSEGFDFCFSNNGHPSFAYGVYKVNCNLTNKYFYLDYRDDKIGFYQGLDLSHIDIYLKYKMNTDSFYVSGDNLSYKRVGNGSLINFWHDIKNYSLLPEIVKFPNYWENCLVAINQGDNHPTIAWGTYPNASFSVHKYKVYRYYTGSPQNVFTSDDEKRFTWADNSVNLNDGPRAHTPVHYFVKAVDIDDVESGSTNTVTVNAAGSNPEKRLANQRSSNIESFNLEQNYPNPFNPNTQISFSIPQSSLVQLKICDVFGRELQTLINGYLNEGNHNYQFDGKNFASGVYFYTLSTGSFSITRKMILIK